MDPEKDKIADLSESPEQKLQREFAALEKRFQEIGDRLPENEVVIYIDKTNGDTYYIESVLGRIDIKKIPSGKPDNNSVMQIKIPEKTRSKEDRFYIDVTPSEDPECEPFTLLRRHYKPGYISHVGITPQRIAKIAALLEEAINQNATPEGKAERIQEITERIRISLRNCGIEIGIAEKAPYTTEQITGLLLEYRDTIITLLEKLNAYIDLSHEKHGRFKAKNAVVSYGSIGSCGDIRTHGWTINRLNADNKIPEFYIDYGINEVDKRTAEFDISLVSEPRAKFLEIKDENIICFRSRTEEIKLIIDLLKAAVETHEAEAADAFGKFGV